MFVLVLVATTNIPNIQRCQNTQKSVRHACIMEARSNISLQSSQAQHPAPDLGDASAFACFEEFEDDGPCIGHEDVVNLGEGARFEELEAQPQGRLLCRFCIFPSDELPCAASTTYAMVRVVDNQFATCLGDDTMCRMHKLLQPSNILVESLVLPMYVLAAYMKLVEKQLNTPIVLYCDDSKPCREGQAWVS